MPKSPKPTEIAINLLFFLRHPEELSLCKPLDPEHLRMNYQVCDQRKNEDAYMCEDEAEILGSGEGLQMSRGSCMRSHMVWFGMVW